VKSRQPELAAAGGDTDEALEAALSPARLARGPLVRLRLHIRRLGHTRCGPRSSPTVLEHGAQLKDVQKAAGHRDPGTTKLYDRCGHNPEKAASFFVIY